MFQSFDALTSGVYVPATSDSSTNVNERQLHRKNLGRRPGRSFVNFSFEISKDTVFEQRCFLTNQIKLNVSLDLPMVRVEMHSLKNRYRTYFI